MPRAASAGVAKRDILLPLVEKVVLHKDSVEVVFTPGLFDEAGGNDPLSNCYTTCIVCKVRRLVCDWIMPIDAQIWHGFSQAA